MNTGTLAAELIDSLPGHLQRQRWYGGKGQIPAAIRIASIEVLQAPWPGLVRAVIECDGAGRYQLLLGLRRLDDTASSGRDPAATVCVVTVAGCRAVCFDALADTELALAVLGHAAPSLATSVAAARPVGAEQSNSSIVYDERLILKVFRRLASPNPDAEVTVALSRAGFDRVAEPLAVWRRDRDDLALLQRFLPGGVDGWTLALASARDGSDLAPESAALGDVTARLHVALAQAFGTWPARPAEWADAALHRIGSSVDQRIDRAAVAAAIDSIREVGHAGRAIRIHGDYHLGQLLRTDRQWYVFDFEGEPTRPVDERRTPASPLRDVAGMLRSFGYAAGAARRASGEATGLRDWEREQRHAFLDAYVARIGGSGLLPDDAAAVDTLLTAFEVDKAVYEIAYEQGSRPDWVDIPLDGLRSLLARSAR